MKLSITLLMALLGFEYFLEAQNRSVIITKDSSQKTRLVLNNNLIKAATIQSNTKPARVGTIIEPQSAKSISPGFKPSGCVAGKILYVENTSANKAKTEPLTDAPFATIREAYNAALQRNYCTAHIVIKNGIYNETISFSLPVTIEGESRDKTIIYQGGFWSLSSTDLHISNVTFKNCTARAIWQKGGTIRLNYVTIDDYKFKESAFVITPSAVELTNVSGDITGLEFTNCDQPNLHIAGPFSNISVIGLSTSHSTALPEFIKHGNDDYISAIQIMNGAKFKLNLGKLSEAQGNALVVSGSVAKISYTEAHNTATVKLGDGEHMGSNFAFLNSKIQGNQITSTGAVLAGMIMDGSTFVGDFVKISGNNYGLAYNPDEVPKDYDINLCFLNKEGVSIVNNKTNIENTSKILSTPNAPVDLPCNPPCPEPKEKPPAPVAKCYEVEL